MHPVPDWFCIDLYHKFNKVYNQKCDVLSLKKIHAVILEPQTILSFIERFWKTRAASCLTRKKLHSNNINVFKTFTKHFIKHLINKIE